MTDVVFLSKKTTNELNLNFRFNDNPELSVRLTHQLPDLPSPLIVVLKVLGVHMLCSRCLKIIATQAINQLRNEGKLYF